MIRSWCARPYIWLFLLLLPQIFGMILIPFSGTSEPRYAEIARLMAEGGDWITPWFEPGVPFWGKPPFSFWVQALSIRLFGLNEWAVRLPSWLGFLAILAAIHALARQYSGLRTARWAVVVYASCALPYIAGVAVLTDPFLTLGTTLCMAGLVLGQWYWRALGFAGLAIGLLSKGPLAGVLVAGSVATGWLICRQIQWPRMSGRVWIWGGAVVIALVLPWYVLAEQKTPGFLNYFLLGEHVLRYLDPGWQGDLYGTAHVEPYGSIWGFWLMATFPWGILALAALLYAAGHSGARQSLRRVLSEPVTAYLLGWSVFSLLLFTFARNLLWTYALPAIPAFSILMGRALSAWQAAPRKPDSGPPRYVTATLASLVPTVMLVASLTAVLQPNLINTERELVRYVQDASGANANFWYIDSRPFSARYYSRGMAELVSIEQVSARLRHMNGDVYMAVTKRQFDQIQHRLPSSSQRANIESKKYVLVIIPGGSGKMRSREKS